MSEIIETNFAVGIPADSHVTPIGPLESRRSRRARNQAVAVPVGLPFSSPEDDSSEDSSSWTTYVVTDQPVVTDELAAARERKLQETAEVAGVSDLDWGG